MASDKNLLSYPVLILNKIGLFNKINTTMETIILAVIILGCTFVVVMSSVQYIFIENDINEYVSNLEATVGISQILWKVLFFVLNKKSFLKLLSISKRLWKIDMCSGIGKLKLNATYEAILRFQKIFFALTVIFLLGMQISIFFGRELPVGIWKMSNYPKLYTFYKHSINVILIPSAIAVCTSDILFIGICYTLIIQFRILCNKIDDLNFDQSKSPEDLKNQYKQLDVCLEYHKFLLSYLYSIQKVYSYVFGIQYITSAPLVCAEIYALWDLDETEPLLIIRNIGNAIYVSFQLSFYCVPADLVVQEARMLTAVTVANALYNCNWYSNSNKEFRKSLQIGILASQREYQFTALGMVEFKPATVLSVIKVAVSASTIFRQLESQ